MRVAVLGTSEFTLRCAQAVLDGGHALAGLVTLPPDFLPLNSLDLAAFSRSREIPCHVTSDINAPETLLWLAAREPDVVVSSWPRLIAAPLLGIAKIATVGTHPTDLPANRGRHPLHWSLVLGLPRVVLSFFRMDAGMDSGDILLKIPLDIPASADIGSLLAQVNDAAYQGLRQLLPMLENAPALGERQDGSRANTWRARTPHDSLLDFRMTALAIARTAASYAPPYPCAKLVFERHLIDIPRAEPAATPDARHEPGRILARPPGRLEVATLDGAVLLHYRGELPETLAAARHIHPPSYYFSRWNAELNEQLTT